MSAFSKWQVAEMTKNPHIFLEMPTLDVSVLGNRRGCVPKQLPCSKPLGKAWSLDFEPVLMPLLLKFYHIIVLGITKSNARPVWEIEYYEGFWDSFFPLPLGMVVPAVRVWGLCLLLIGYPISQVRKGWSLLWWMVEAQLSKVTNSCMQCIESWVFMKLRTRLQLSGEPLLIKTDINMQQISLLTTVFLHSFVVGGGGGWLVVCLFAVLGIEPWASCILAKCFTTEPHLQSVSSFLRT